MSEAQPQRQPRNNKKTPTETKSAAATVAPVTEDKVAHDAPVAARRRRPAKKEATTTTAAAATTEGGESAPRVRRARVVRPPLTDGEAMPNEVFLRNLPRENTRPDVEALVTPFGTTKAIRLIRHYGRLSVHVKYETAEVATNAIAGLTGKEIGGRTITAGVYYKKPIVPKAPAATTEGEQAPNNRRQQRKPRTNATTTATTAATGSEKPRREPRRERKPRDASAGAGASAGGAGANGEKATPARSITVFYGNLPKGIPKEEFVSKLTTKPAKIHLRYRFALVKYETPEIANAVVAAGGFKIGENDVKVEFSQRLQQRKRRVLKPKAAAATPTLKVYIGKLPFGYNDQDLVKGFVGTQQIETHDRFAYVSFDTQEHAAAAVSKNNTVIIGTTPNPVEYARK